MSRVFTLDMSRGSRVLKLDMSRVFTLDMSKASN